jgi:hypothetical protein
MKAEDIDQALDFANAQLVKIGMGKYLRIVPGSAYGSAELWTAGETEPSGKARRRDREQADEPVAAVRRLLVRALWRDRYR